MVRAKRRPDSAEQISAEEKIARLLALLVTRDVEKPGDKIITLQAVGFRVSETALILGMSENAINVALHRARKKDALATKLASRKKKPVVNKGPRK